MDRSSPASRGLWQTIAGAALLALLATLGTLQYRWLGDVSAAERERMRTTLRAHVTDFSEAIDRELTRTYVSFHLDASQLAADPDRAVSGAFARWQTAAPAPNLIAAVYLFEPSKSTALRKLDAARGRLEPTVWPPVLEEWVARGATAAAKGLRLPPDPIEPSTPALVVLQPTISRLPNGERMAVVQPGLELTTVIVVLDRDQLLKQLVEPQAAKYFGAADQADQSEYVVTIARQDRPGEIVYASDARTIVDARSADATAGLFDLRIDELARLNAPPPPTVLHTESQTSTTKMAITIVRRAPEGRLVIGAADGPDHGAWQVRARYRRGSLDAIVERSRRRNLAIGLGVLALLAASFVLIVAAAARQQRLARQQIEFIAAVSHELRTPLAVIRSAGENLADGVVANADQVKRYGSVIQAEGRRLSDMVERVMQFAGMTSGAALRADAEIDVRRVVDEAVAAAAADARERQIEIVVHAGAAPRINGDADALRSALHNVIGNAVKYSEDGGRIDVELSEADGRVRVGIADRGIGIDPADLPHVFQPFFRGRRAMAAQIRGTGIGLGVVRQVVAAHRGTVRVENRAGGGTSVTIELPAIEPVVAEAAPHAVRNTST